MKTQTRNFLSVLIVAGIISFLAGPALAEVVTFNFTGTITSVSDTPFGLNLSLGQQVQGSITYDTSLPPSYDSSDDFGHLTGYMQSPPSGMSLVIAGATGATIQSQYSSFQVMMINDPDFTVGSPCGFFQGPIDNVNGYFSPIFVNQVSQANWSAIGFTLNDYSQTALSSTALPPSLNSLNFSERIGCIYDDASGGVADFSIDTLEKREILTVKIDIKPGSCPNPITLRDSGTMPIAIMGTADFDISQIDPASISLSREGVDAEVAPLRWSYYDAGIPFEGELCDCVGARHDRITDLVLKFSAPAIINALRLAEVVDKTIPLTITGNLKPEFGSTPITGQDCLRILKK